MSIKDRLLLPILLFIVGLIYILFFPRIFNFDGTVFAQYLRIYLVKGTILPNLPPHHLFYLPFAAATYKLLGALFSYHPLEYIHLQWISIFFGLASLSVIYRFLKKTIGGTYYPFFGTLLIAFSFTFWILSTEAEVHMPGFFFIISGWYWLLFRDEAPKNLVLAALLFTIAAGFHLTNVLILISSILLFWTRKTPLKKIAWFCSSYLFFIFIPYLIFSILSGKNLIRTFYNQLFGVDTFSGNKNNYWSLFLPRALLSSTLTIKKAFLGENHTQLLGWILFLMILGLVLFYLIKKDSLFSSQLFWFLPYFIFFTYWCPGVLEFKLSPLVILALLFTISWSRQFPGRIGRLLFLLILTIIFSIVMSFNMVPTATIENNKDFYLAEAIGQKTEMNAEIVIAGNYSGFGVGKIYIPYFSNRQVVILDWLLGKGNNLEKIAFELRQKIENGRKIYFLSEITYLSPAMEELLKTHHLQFEKFKNLLNQFQLQPHIKLDNSTWIAEIK